MGRRVAKLPEIQNTDLMVKMLLSFSLLKYPLRKKIHGILTRDR